MSITEQREHYGASDRPTPTRALSNTATYYILPLPPLLPLFDYFLNGGCVSRTSLFVGEQGLREPGGV